MDSLTPLADEDSNSSFGQVDGGLRTERAVKEVDLLNNISFESEDLDDSILGDLMGTDIGTFELVPPIRHPCIIYIYVMLF